MKNTMEEAIMASNELQSMVDATMPSGTCLRDMLSSVKMGLSPSCTPSSPSSPAAASVTLIQSSISTRQHEGEVEIPILMGLPHHVIHSLVDNYLQQVLLIYPFLYEPAIWENVDQAIRKIPKQ